MKRLVCIVMVAMFSFVGAKKAEAQAQELEELALDIEKLAQFKQILSDLKKGYEILSGGYNTIRDISKGQFQLHKLFLDGLLAVSPEVRNYKRVVDIIEMQIKIVSEYKAANNWFRTGSWFNPSELGYIGSVYGNLVNLSLKNLDDLTTILTAGKLRMSDDERIAGIDKIYLDMQDKLVFLRHFNNSTKVLALQKARELQGTSTLKQFYNFK